MNMTRSRDRGLARAVSRALQVRPPSLQISFRLCSSLQSCPQCYSSSAYYFPLPLQMFLLALSPARHSTCRRELRSVFAVTCSCPNYAYNNVVRITRNGALINSTAVSGQPFGLATDVNGDVYVASDAVIKLHGATGAILAVWTDGLTAPLGVAVNQYVYAADQGSNSIVKLTLFGTVVSSFPVPGQPKGVAVDAAGAVYVSINGAVLKFDTQGNLRQNFTSSSPNLTFLRDVVVIVMATCSSTTRRTT